MNLFSVIKNVAKLPIAAALDVLTLGGVCNDGYFLNDHRCYTRKAADEVMDEVKEVIIPPCL